MSGSTEGVNEVTMGVKKKFSGKIKKKTQNEIKMSPALSQWVNIKHCREIYMAVRRVDQTAKYKTPPVTYNNTSILSPPIISAFTDQTNRSSMSIVTCLRNETGRCGREETMIHI